MADFELKLRQLSERGHPVGAEELIERIEAELAGNPIVVVAKQRKGPFMTKTDEITGTGPSRRLRVVGWAVTAFIMVVAAVVVYLALSPGADRVADTLPSPTSTTEPETEAMTDLEIVEAGVAAFYSGDGDRVAELFELTDFDDEQLRSKAAYEAAVGGRLTLDCTEKDTAGDFTCRTPYFNALTDVTQTQDPGDVNDVRVRDGVILEFGFPEHTWILLGIGAYLASEGRFEEYENCVPVGLYPVSCAVIQIESAEAWNDWRKKVEPPEMVDLAVQAWYGGDCDTAQFLAGLEPDCSTPELPRTALTIEYEAILGAEVTLENCSAVKVSADEDRVSCEVHYSNAMNAAVGKPPAVIAKEFSMFAGLSWDWFETDYPEDAELRESFTAFAEGGDLAEAYAAANCDSARTPECATLIVDNLEAWAAWYASNG